MNDHIKLKAYLDSVPRGKYTETRKKIAKECFVTDGVLVHWLSGRTQIPPLTKPVIEKIAGEKIFTN